VAELQETVKRLRCIRGPEMEIHNQFQKHIPVVDTTENETFWTLVTHKSRTPFHPLASQPKKDMKL